MSPPRSSDDSREHVGAAAGAEALALLDRSGQCVAYSLGDLRRVIERVRRSPADGPPRVLLVADRGAVEAASASERLDAHLAGWSVQRLEGPPPNPQLAEGLAAARVALGFRADVVLAVGGGSCIDLGKLAVAAPRLGLLTAADVGGPIADVALVAAPTTSGSGSEATPFAVAYQGGVKQSYSHPSMRPAGVVLERDFAVAMPDRLAAQSGLDALAQGVESLWAVGGDAASYRYAEPAARLAAGALRDSVARRDEASRVTMMAAACLAGQAIALSRTTAAHALSYRLTACHGVAHGHAVALTLGWVGRANAEVRAADCVDPRGPAHVRRQTAHAAGLLGCSPAQMPGAVRRLLADLGLPQTLRAAGVPIDAIDALADSANGDRMGNNPRRFDREGLRRLLWQAYDDAP